MMGRGPLAFKQSDVTRALKGTVKAGMEASRLEIDKDGKIVVIIGKPDAPHDVREIVL